MNPWRRRGVLAAYLFILPNLVGFLLFTSLPVLASLTLSFFEWDLLHWPPRWVGLGNFSELLADASFWKYFWNTLVLMAGIPVSILLSLFLAVLMNQKLRGMVVYRTVFFLPSITAGVGTYLLWMSIYNPEFGLINWLLRHLWEALAWCLAWVGVGLPAFVGPGWLQDVFWAKPALILMGIWGSMGGTNMILYLAALQAIPPELYEAADIDGASAWSRFWRITWPMVSPTTFFLSVMGIIGGFQGGFNQAHVMTGGGPAGSTTTISYYIYQNAYVWFRMGYAASIAWVLFVVVFVLTMVNWRFGQKRVHYG
ncbi:MAG: sugar ABC transporter permease [Lentisphaerae bacterium]|nr:sugar ABC transporter permease [Lentisphaerota bacterium]